MCCTRVTPEAAVKLSVDCANPNNVANAVLVPKRMLAALKFTPVASALKPIVTRPVAALPLRFHMLSGNWLSAWQKASISDWIGEGIQTFKEGDLFRDR